MIIDWRLQPSSSSSSCRPWSATASATRKVYLILDNLGVTLQTREGVACGSSGTLKSSSCQQPELKPDRRLNTDLKRNRLEGSVRTKAKLRAAADEHIQFIAANRDRVRSYFQDPIVKYTD